MILARVSASTTNLGPGFDCLGVALSLWNEVIIYPEEGPQQPAPEIVTSSAAAFCARAAVMLPPFRCEIRGEVPQARGLGSSTTVRAGVLLALNHMSGQVLSRQEIFALCAELEGHPDNAAAAIFGGFTIVSCAGRKVDRFDVSPQLKFVLFVPDFEVKTAHARTVVPTHFARADVVQNLANSSLISAAFASQDYERLRGAFTDRMHQPYRKQFVPFMSKVFEAALENGALGGFLSGSGSTLACVALTDPEKIAKAMADAVSDLSSRTLILSANNEGATTK
ncbi:MAG: homoserine kinase [Verrucomicrobia bacterium]|nr:homoserine kinase [Verrucomicrobiota bacterium]